MPLDKAKLTTVLFDYGNTLIEFGPDQIAACDDCLLATLTDLYGECDIDTYRQLRREQRLRPYSGNYVENKIPEKASELAEKLFSRQPTDDELAQLHRVRYEVMVAGVVAEPEVRELLKRLGSKYSLGLVSNYPDADAIRETLVRNGLDQFFDAVVVSAEVGHVKPHPLIFQTIVNEMDIEPHQAVYVGDNWLGDIQGSKRAGMQCIYTTQFVPYENFTRQDGDHEPDLTVGHFRELLEHLL